MFLLERKVGFRGQGQECLLYVCQAQLVDEFFGFVLAEQNVASNKKFSAFSRDMKQLMAQIQSVHFSLTRGETSFPSPKQPQP